MAATSTTHVAKAEERGGANLTTQTGAVRSAEDTDTCLKKVGLAEALREEGIDERAIAQGFASLHSKLSGSEDKGDLKLFFDVLKDNHRTLEPPTPSERSGIGDAPVTIILKHNMARPARETSSGISDSDRFS